MGRNTPGKRDGSGPWKGSYQKTHGKGRRQADGKPCPKRK